MNSPNESVSMALFCDFENVALGVRDAKYQKFDIKPVLERLLLKGSIVVKKAYCDWERYKEFKAPMHEANFELIEIPHVRQSGKNSADIRLVVDALDFCYTKSHVNTFVIISGDSDFSPLVSKLRENNKKVIGVGVKQSTSDLLIANCDEFIFYDDLVRERQRAEAKRDTRGNSQATKRSPEEERRRREEMEVRKAEAIEMAVETFDALVSERGDSGKIWASVLKEAMKRRKPDFNESYYGFRAFGNLLEEAQSRGLLQFGRDEKSGAYVYRENASLETPSSAQTAVETFSTPVSAPAPRSAREPRRRRNNSQQERAPSATAAPVTVESPVPLEHSNAAALAVAQEANAVSATLPVVDAAKSETRRGTRGGRKTATRKPRADAGGPRAAASEAQANVMPTAPTFVAAAVPDVAPVKPAAAKAPIEAEDKPAKAPRKTTTRARRPRKTAAASEDV